MSHLRIIQEIAQTLGGGRDIERSIPKVLEKTCKALDAAASQLTIWIDMPDAKLKTIYGESALLLAEDSPLLNLVQQEPFASIEKENLPAGVQEIFLARISGAKKAIGALQVVTKNKWTPDHQELTEVIATEIGIALVNAGAFSLMHRRNSELEWLNKVGDSLHNLLSSLRIEEVVERIMLAARDLLHAEETSIMLKDYESDDLILWSHTPAERDLTIRLKPGQGVAGWVYEYGKTAIVNDVRKDPRWESTFDQEENFTTRSLIAVPILIDGDIIGVLEGINKINGEFSETDEVLLKTLAKWAAIAIGNANAYDNLSRAGEQLADAKKQAAMANMVLNLAHKINNSVGAIRVWAMEAREGLNGRETPELKEFIESILANTEETLLMVRRIRGATELHVGDIQPLSITEVLDTAVQFSRLAPSISVERHYESSLPPVGADPEQLIEVFLHLINNAADVLGRKGKITLSCRRSQNGLIEAMVQDDGSGIPEHLKSRIFEPFVTSKVEGLGLGLWMVKLYIEMIGGLISVSSSSKGTIFRLTLPPWQEKHHA